MSEITLLRPNIQPTAPLKMCINVGAGFDIPTGTYVIGRRGEHILNGGLAPITGVVGIGNSFKTTISDYLHLTALSHSPSHCTTQTFDTEVNVNEQHKRKAYERMAEFKGEDIITTGRWLITDKQVYSGNKWYDLQREFLEDKIKNKKLYEIASPFWNREKTAPLMVAAPNFTLVDSLTYFETDDVTKMMNENELGESGGNTIFMRQGLAKKRLIMESTRLYGGSGSYLLMTAHIGKETMMQNAGPGGQVPVVKNKYLKHGDKVKGATDDFLFATHNCYQCVKTRPMIHKDTKAPEYPRDSRDDTEYSTDLNEVELCNLRSKFGISGMTQTVVVSQTEGVLPSLTEFHYIKEMKRFGIEGNNVTYNLVLYPAVKLQRTTVRRKLDENPRLQRAVQITAELCQMHEYWTDQDPELLPTPEQLYNDLKAKGYDWDQLLDTRGWWSFDENHPVPFLSTMDLLKMRVGEYHPYWMDLLPGMTKRPVPLYGMMRGVEN